MSSVSLSGVERSITSPREVLEIGVTQAGQTVTVWPHNPSVPQEILQEEHAGALKAALAEIVQLPRPTSGFVCDINVHLPQHSVGMIYHGQRPLERTWHQVELVDGRTGVVPFAWQQSSDLAQIKLHFRGSHLVKGVLRTGVLMKGNGVQCEYWRNNSFVKRPECMAWVNPEPVPAPSWL